MSVDEPPSDSSLSEAVSWLGAGRHRWIPRHALALGLAVGLLSGCTTIELALGLRTRLANLPVTSIAATLGDGGGLGPGKSARLVIVATLKDGKRLVTVGPGKGKVVFSSFGFTSILVQVNKKGVVSLPNDPRATEGSVGHIHISVVNHPEIEAEVDVPVRYDVAFDANFSGAPGASGQNGSDGTSGISGSAGSSDPKNPCAGGNGDDGGDGSAGGDGGDGGDGSTVHAWVTLRSGAKPMIEARVEDQLFLIDPERGSLNIHANGGAGGRGGSGGSGGPGGSGGSGTPNGNDGSEGQAGKSGNWGNPGKAGRIAVSIDPQADASKDRIHLENVDGDGKAGLLPLVTIEPVPLIW